MSRMRDWWGKSNAICFMLAVQLISTGLQILSRMILSEGSFVFAILTYRHLVAAVSIAPFAFFLERDKWKNITSLVVLWLLLNALTGIIMGMGMFYYGLKETDATFATNFLNLIPIATFIFSVILRMESLGLDTKRGKVKVGGALLCVGGALVMSLYKGKVMLSSRHTHSLDHVTTLVNVGDRNQTVGTMLLVGSCLSYAAWFIVQIFSTYKQASNEVFSAKMVKAFPFKYWTTMLTCLLASIQSATIGLCINRSNQAWKLQWNLQLITIIYSGILASALTFYLVSWTIAKKGPTYAPMFNPVGLIFVALVEMLFLGVDLRLGSLLGMVLIVLGIYAFLWGMKVSAKKQAVLQVVTNFPLS